MSCFVMARRAPLRFLSVMSERRLRIPNTVPPSRLVPFCSLLLAAGLPGKPDPFPRVKRARAGAPLRRRGSRA